MRRSHARQRRRMVGHDAWGRWMRIGRVARMLEGRTGMHVGTEWAWMRLHRHLRVWRAIGRPWRHHVIGRIARRRRRRGLKDGRIAFWRTLAAPADAPIAIELVDRSERRCGWNCCWVDIFSRNILIQILKSKAWVSQLEQSLALGQLVLDMLDMASGCECLTMPVFLVALGACSCTGGTARMLRVALLRNVSEKRLEIAVGVARRHLPLFSYSCIARMLHGIAVIVAVQKGLARRHRPHQPFCDACRW